MTNLDIKYFQRNIGDEIFLQNDGWCIVSAIFPTQYVLYSIQEIPRKIYANRPYKTEHKSFERSPEKICNHTKFYGKAIHNLRHLDYMQSVFYYCLKDGSKELRPANMLFSGMSKAELLDLETKKAIKINDCRLVIAYELP